MPQKLMLYTDEQIVVIEKITKATRETYSDLVRRLLAAEASRLDIEWPDNMPTRDDTIREAQKKRWPKRPDAGTRVIFVQGEDEFHGERRSEMTIEEADAQASEILGEPVQMRFNEDIRVDGPAPHTMRGSSMWIELVPPGSLR